MSQLSRIKERIRVIRNLRKVTNAMELVTKTKIGKIRLCANQAKEYQQKFQQLFATVYTAHGGVKPTQEEKLCYVFGIVSQKGFCGNFNDKLLQLISKTLRSMPGQINITMLGKKTSKMNMQLRKRAFTHFEGKEKNYQTELTPIIQKITQEILTGYTVEVYCLFNEFKSVLEQKPTLQQIYPLNMKKDKNLPSVEPDISDLFDQLLPAYMLSCFDRAYWESAAGEYCSRLMAMKNANDNAALILEKLTVEFNKTRQLKINQELSEIVSSFDILALASGKKNSEGDTHHA